MSEPIKIKQEELDQITKLQSKFQATIFKMGELHVEKMELDRAVNEFIEKEKTLNSEWSSLQADERGILDNIIKNYGEGSLDMNNGTFIPSPKNG